ncbi:MAG: DUF5668 domain-containing protein [bacterium]|nr:DUF5668 domain-containing protein [bacterium]
MSESSDPKVNLDNNPTNDNLTVIKPQKVSNSPISVLPLILILFGVYLLLREYGLVDNSVIKSLIKLWPLLLIYFGLDRLLTHNKVLKTISVILLISFAVFCVLMQSGDQMLNYR